MSWIADLLGLDDEKPKPPKRKRSRRRKAIPPDLRLKIFARDEYTCTYCDWSSHPDRASLELDLDHRTPVVKGGTNARTNLVTACNRCNGQKGKMTEDEYRRWRRENPKRVSIRPHQRGGHDLFVEAGQLARVDLLKAARKRLGF